MQNKSKKVAFISQPEYFRFMYENDLDNFAIVKEFVFNSRMTCERLSDLLQFNADYNIFFRGEFIPNEVLKGLRGVCINLSSEPFPRTIKNKSLFSYNSLVRYREFRSIREKAFDYIFHYDAASLRFMRKDGLILSGHFAFPVATNVYKPLNTPINWDLFFIGRSTKHREILFSPLKQNYRFLHIAHGLWGEQLVNYINASKICLNTHAINEISWEPRLQMLLACKAFVISEPITPNDYLKPGIHYVEAKCQDEFHLLTKYYLEQSDERKKIAERGYIRVIEKLDSKKVFPVFLQNISNSQYNKFQANSGHVFCEIFDRFWTYWQIIKKSFKTFFKRLFP